MSKLAVIEGENLEILPKLASSTVDLIYIDPPFNTGKQQERTQLKTVASQDGDRVGFNGKRYTTVKVGTLGYKDIFSDYLAFLEPRIREAYRLLTDRGSLFFHIDYRESHYCKILLDSIFGRDCFMNEIIWSYDYGARSKKRWSCKHDTIFWYVKTPSSYIYNYFAIDRVPYMAPSLVGEEKAEKGKTPTDVLWNTIVSPSGREKTGYATQKPRKILERIISVHSNSDSLVGDFFAGSGTFGAAAYILQRDCFLIDKHKEAIDVMKKRFIGLDVQWYVENDSKKNKKAEFSSKIIRNPLKKNVKFDFMENRFNRHDGNAFARYSPVKYPSILSDSDKERIRKANKNKVALIRKRMLERKEAAAKMMPKKDAKQNRQDQKIQKKNEKLSVNNSKGIAEERPVLHELLPRETKLSKARKARVFVETEMPRISRPVSRIKKQ